MEQIYFFFCAASYRTHGIMAHTIPELTFHFTDRPLQTPPVQTGGRSQTRRVLDKITRERRERQTLQDNSKEYFKPNHQLKRKMPHFCRCVLHVAAKNSNWCNKKRLWKSDKCYNPYAVCAASVRTTTGRKPCFYDFDSPDMTKKELKSYGYLRYKEYTQWAKEKKRKKLYQLRSKKQLRLHLSDFYDSKYKKKVGRRQRQ